MVGLDWVKIINKFNCNCSG